VDAAPTPAAVEAAPTPAAVEAAPTPTAVDAAPTPAVVEAAPTPAVVDAAPTPAAVEAPYTVKTRKQTPRCQETALACLVLPGVSDVAHDFSNRLLGIAALWGCDKVVTALLALPRVSANAHARYQYALRAAAESGNLGIVDQLLALPHVRCGAGTMFDHAIVTAAFVEAEDVALRLLDLPEVAGQAVTLGNLTLRYAASGDLRELTRRLLLLPAVAADAGGRCNEALREAAGHGYLQIVQLLLQVPAVRERAAWPRNLALLQACKKGALPVVDELLRVPAIAAAAACDLNECLRNAAKEGHLAVVQRMVEVDVVRSTLLHGANVALRWAAAGGHVAVVRFLLTLPEVRDAAAAMRMDAWRAAAQGNHVEVLQELAAVPAVSDLADYMSCDALIFAVRRGHAGAVQCNVAVPCVAESITSFASTLWDAAAVKPSASLMRALVSCPAIRAMLPLARQLPAAIADKALSAAATASRLASEAGGHDSETGDAGTAQAVFTVPQECADLLEALHVLLTAWNPAELTPWAHHSVLQAAAWSRDADFHTALAQVPGHAALLHLHADSIATAAVQARNWPYLADLLARDSVAAELQAAEECAPLHAAILAKNVDVVLQLLELQGVQARAHAEGNRTLIAAAERGLDGVVHTLLSLPAVAAVPQHELFQAVALGCSEDTFRWLMAPAPDGFGLRESQLLPHTATILERVVESKNVQRLQRVLTVPSLDRALPLHTTDVITAAIRAGHPDMLPLLLAREHGEAACH